MSHEPTTATPAHYHLLIQESADENKTMARFASSSPFPAYHKGERISFSPKPNSASNQTGAYTFFEVVEVAHAIGERGTDLQHTTYLAVKVLRD